MIKRGEVISYAKEKSFRSIVLEDVLKMFAEKGVEIIKLPARFRSQIDNSATGFAKSLRKDLLMQKNSRDNCVLAENRVGRRFGANKKISKIAEPTTTDIITYKIINEIILGNSNNLKEFLPVDKKIIKPLCLFLDKEVLLYAKLKKLKFKKVVEEKSKTSLFIDELEKKHPEVKRAVVNGWLKLNN